MIYGIGIDIIETERIRLVSQKPSFLEKVFTCEERELFLKSRNSVQMIAGRFAAKEAVSKALGTGIGKIGWHDIEVLQDSYGKPYVKLHGRATELFKSISGEKIFLSITHVRSLAAAQAVVEKSEQEG